MLQGEAPFFFDAEPGVSYFVAMRILSPLGRGWKMAMSSIAAALVNVVLNLLLDSPFRAVDTGVARLATEEGVLCIEP